MPLKLDMHNGPLIMGIVNVTPDSFSDGGQYNTTDAAYDHAMTLLDEGADILDIGGESTRPGASPVEPQMEIDRVAPLIERLSQNSDAPISIDTRNAETMREALKAGARIVNDVRALSGDDESVNAARDADWVCLMHMQGQPQTMQKNPIYNNVIEDVFQFFEERIAFCETHGIEKNKLILDPGIGFGKGLQHNLDLMAKIDRFHDLNCPLLLGTSRKSFIPKIMDKDMPANQRIGGSLASVLYGLQKGVQLFRVHDVAQTCQAFKTYQMISSSA